MNRKILYPIIIVCCIIIIACWYHWWFNPLTTIILVRHAEKGPGQDPPLTEAGHKRAGALAHAVSSAGVDVIFVSDALRTQQTADSAAALLGLTPEILDVNSVVNRIKSDHQGEVVLVVGHSNTVPQIIEGLGVSSPPAIAETEFDNLFIVHRHKYGLRELTHLKYGKHLCPCSE